MCAEEAGFCSTGSQINRKSIPELANKDLTHINFRSRGICRKEMEITRQLYWQQKYCFPYGLCTPQSHIHADTCILHPLAHLPASVCGKRKTHIITVCCNSNVWKSKLCGLVTTPCPVARKLGSRQAWRAQQTWGRRAMCSAPPGLTRYPLARRSTALTFEGEVLVSF